MFRLLIADDEDLVRRGLKALIEREAPDLAIVGVAGDGTAALELAEQHRPDIMLTDIRMPGLNGLELIARLRGGRPDLECIVLSGYDDFEYARRSISLDVGAYLLKPIDPDQLLAALAQAQERVAAQRDALRVQRQAREALAQAYLRRLLDGYPGGVNAEPQPLEEAPAWGLLLLHAPETASRDGTMRLAALCRQVLPEATLVEDGEGYSCLVVPLARSDRDAWGLQALTLHQALADAGWAITIAVAAPVEDPAMLASAHADALDALDAHPHCASAPPQLCWQATTDHEGVPPLFPVTLTDDLLHATATQGEDIAARAATRLLDYLREHGTLSPRTLFPQLMLLVIQQAQRRGVRAESLLAEERDLRELLARGAERANGEACVIALVRRAARACEQLDSAHILRGTIPELRAYIAGHLDDDLSIGALGRHMHVNPKYLADLFKQACGQPLGEYIIHARMVRACELLSGTNERVYNIAERVGYRDPKHFAAMFRQVIGMSPADYRAARRQVGTADAEPGEL